MDQHGLAARASACKRSALSRDGSYTQKERSLSQNSRLRDAALSQNPAGKPDPIPSDSGHSVAAPGQSESVFVSGTGRRQAAPSRAPARARTAREEHRAS